MTRQETLNSILNKIKPEDLVICSLGKMARELFWLRKKRNEPNDDFIIQGAMGSAIGVGLGVAMNTEKRVHIFIGDGALLMKLGSLATAIKYSEKGSIHIHLLQNNVHDSTGGQLNAIEEIQNFVNAWCTVYQVDVDNKSDLARPNISCAEITKRFIKKIHA